MTGCFLFLSRGAEPRAHLPSLFTLASISGEVAFVNTRVFPLLERGFDTQRCWGSEGPGNPSICSSV